MGLLDKPEVNIYKPFKYPKAYDFWLLQQQIHWLPEEVPMGYDVRDFNNNLNASERHLITQIFRFFTQADVEVSNNYNKHYMKVFHPTEIQMMLAAFSNAETIHIAAYSHLLDTMGMPEIEYQAFLEYKEMKDKYDYMHSFSVDDKHEIAKTLAAFGAFTEGLQLFASFAILMNFPRHNKMNGMGQIVTWSVRDESLHCEGMFYLLDNLIRENPEIWTAQLKEEIYEIADTIINHEDAFIDLAFELGGVEGLEPQEVKNYIRYIGDRRLLQLNMATRYNVRQNPLPWMDDMLNAPEHANFFETRSTAYAKTSTLGTWDQAWFDMDKHLANLPG